MVSLRHADLTADPPETGFRRCATMPFLAKKNSDVALLFFRSLDRQRRRVSAETRPRWLIIRCKKQQKQPAVPLVSDTARRVGASYEC
jgi:hypothetical protein